MHGVKYLGEKQRHWLERIFWVIAFMISFLGCCVLINKIYVKWQLSPVIVSFAEKSTPVWQIPFPAVTICPETKALKESIDFTRGYFAIKSNFTMFNLTSDELKNLEAISQICDPHLFIGDHIDSELESKDILPLLKKITMSLNETTLFCKWRNNIDACNKYFVEMITEEGFCYTFNVLNSSELFRENV